MILPDDDITEDNFCEGVDKQNTPIEEKDPELQPDKIEEKDEDTEFLRCKNCSRKTKGKEDFINKKNGNITKTCLKCRESVKKSLAKIKAKHQPVKPLKLVDCCNSLFEILKKRDIELDEEEQEDFLKVLSKMKII